ncbi:hypothetical protein E2C01_022512 [Portunus trituberculatus]|uniref:Uncharacterized protein n=1 Tax=Portunus trituberculatus TaxID=210409 RepID=A0A5B7E7H0_PORTR|nr:hypothetical protein [Portunus trituberculatus]
MTLVRKNSIHYMNQNKTMQLAILILTWARLTAFFTLLLLEVRHAFT